MRIFKIFVKVILSLIVLLVVVVFGAFSYMDYIEGPHPRDEVMIDLFNKERGSFFKLAENIRSDFRTRRKDSGLHIALDEPGPYHETLVRLNIQNVHTWGPSEIEFFVHGKGNVIAGSEKGYLYSERNLEPISENLSDAAKEFKKIGKKFSGYRRIDKNWYIFYAEDW